MSIRALPLLLPLALLSAGCGFRGGDYPSLAPRLAETPRVIEAPGANSVPTLSTEERSGLTQDLAREQAALAEAQRDIATSGRALASALAAPDVSQQGSAAWSNAQMQLSRFDLARSPLDSIDARLAPLHRLTDDLPQADADRQAVEKLASQVAAESAAAQKVADNAARRLG